MSGRNKDFYPHYLVEILVVIFVTIELAVVLALLFPPPVGRPINFSTPFIPRPEWYFLWLYQLIKYFPGPSMVIGAVGLPLVGLAALLLTPFIDRGKWGPLAVAGACALLLAVVLLTVLALSPP